MSAARRYDPRHLARSVAVLGAAFLCGVVRLGAQEAGSPVLLGLGGGYEGGWQWSRFPVFASEPACDQFTTGTVGMAGGGPVMLLPSIGGSRVGVMIRVGGVRSAGDFTFVPPDSLLLFQDEAHRVVRAAHEYHYRTIAAMLRLDLLCSYAVNDLIDAGLGASIGYRRPTGGSAIESLPADGALRFPDGSLERNLPGEFPLAWRSLGLGAVLRGGARLPMGHGLVLVPEISLRADLLSAVAGIDLRSVALGGGLAILYDLSPAGHGASPPPAVAVDRAVPPVEGVPPIPPAPTTIPPRDTSLTASIELYGLDEREERLPTATVRVMETHRRLLLVPSRWIDFEAGSTLLPAMYRRRGDGGIRFALDSLWSLEAGAIPLLDIVGARMRQSPAATLTLEGERRRGESVRIGRDRAESIRRYLDERWDIDRSRIVIEEAVVGQGVGSPPRVLLRPEPPSLLDSVVVELTARDPDPPLIGIDPLYHSAAGVRRWTITLSYDGRQVGRYASDDREASPALNWQGAGESEAPLVADLLMEDSLGREVAARAELPLLLERRSRVVERTIMQREGSERLLFSVPWGHGADAAVAEAIASMHDGARVVVAPSAGGGSGRARDLLRRLRSAAEAKGVRGVVWSEGEEALSVTGMQEGDLIVTVEQRIGTR